MIAFLLAVLGFGKSVMTAVLTWLSRRSLGEVGFIILACLAMFLLFRANHWKSVATQRQAQLVTCGHDKQALQDKLDQLGRESKQQQDASGKIIDHYITVTKPGLIRERVKIESAPLPGNCRTPQEVLNADI